MATAIEVMGDRVSKDVKNIADGHSQVFGDLLRIGKSPSAEAFSKQREFILENIGSRATSVSRLAGQIMQMEMPMVPAEDEHGRAKELKERERLDRHLKSISSANVKLFVDLNVYKNFLADARESIAKQFPEATNPSRIERETQLKELMKELGNVAKDANKTMKELADKKMRDLYRMPMSEKEVKSLKEDISEIKDDDGNCLSARLGTNLVKFENAAPPRSVQESIVNDEVEIAERLPKQDREFLSRLAVVGGSTLSMGIIRELSVIEVRLGTLAVHNTGQYVDGADSDAGKTAHPNEKRSGEDEEDGAVKFSQLEVQEIIARGAGTSQEAGSDAVCIIRDGMQQVPQSAVKAAGRKDPDAIKPIDSKSRMLEQDNTGKSMPRIVDADVITPMEIIKNAGQGHGSMTVQTSVPGASVRLSVADDEDEIVLEPLVFGLSEEELKRPRLYNAFGKRTK